MVLIFMAMAVATAINCGCELSIEDMSPKYKAYLQSTEVRGDSTSCAVVLEAQQGSSYAITISTNGNWATFSDGTTHLSGTMEGEHKAVVIYFGKNDSGVVREADIEVKLADKKRFNLCFRQLIYDAEPKPLVRDWPELPTCGINDGYIYNTHYGQLNYQSKARNYTYCFSPEYRASMWVAYPLHTSHLSGPGQRKDNFDYDMSIDTTYQAKLKYSYKGRYDRGHQLPAADRKCSQEMMDQTFYATNMTPQYSTFNQNKWGTLEGRVRNQACKDTLYVVTGAHFEGEHDGSIASYTTDNYGQRCATPTYYYKVLLRTTSGNTGRSIATITDASELRAIAVWMKHVDTKGDNAIKREELISVAELEELTGFEFFPMLDDSVEEQVKQSVDVDVWGLM